MSESVIVNESKRQTVILVFGAIGTVVTIYLIREFSRPDAFRELKMKSALLAKRVCQRQADWWQKRADDAATAYHRETM